MNLRWVYPLKVFVYTAVVLNAAYYVYLDVQTALLVDPGESLLSWGQTFYTTIDYAGWLLLVALFQLQKDSPESEKMKSGKVWALGSATLVGFLLLGLALYLNFLEVAYYDEYVPHASEEVCIEQDEPQYFLDEEQMYQLVTPENCAALAAGSVLRHPTDNSLVEAGNRIAGKRLELVNAFNTAAWLALVITFQFRLLIQRVRPRWDTALKWSDRAKAFFYLVLFASAIYWFYGGTWVDAWDAFLWLFAFLMLEVVVPDEDETEPEPQVS